MAEDNIDFDNDTDVKYISTLRSNQFEDANPPKKKPGYLKTVRTLTKVGMFLLKVIVGYLALSGIAGNVYYFFIK